MTTATTPTTADLRAHFGLTAVPFTREIPLDEGAHRRRGQKVGRFDFAEEFTFELAPLPCWDDLPREEIRRRIRAMVEEIEAETLARIKETGRNVLGPYRVLSQHPHHAPDTLSRSPAPLVHAATRSAAIALWIVHCAFHQCYRHGAEQLRAGKRDATFPPGSFPPGLPFCRGQPPTAT